MNEDTARTLREPFPDEEIGKRPLVTCADCRDKTCRQHQRQRCPECGNYTSSAHIHLDYVGHAEITDRLLQADPEWTWEPMTTDEHGLPAFDSQGGLWIWLTVGGVTRPGYGHADRKSSGDAVKEIIGDALRNGAMRFGCGIDMWRRDTPTDPPEPDRRDDQADQLRNQIAEYADTNGYRRDQVAVHFQSTTNTNIRTASAAQLSEYLSLLDSGLIPHE